MTAQCRSRVAQSEDQESRCYGKFATRADGSKISPKLGTLRHSNIDISSSWRQLWLEKIVLSGEEKLATASQSHIAAWRDPCQSYRPVYITAVLVNIAVTWMCA